MKTSDILLLVGGIAAAYVFLPRQEAEAGGVSIIPGPTEIVEVPGPIQFIEKLIPFQIPGATEFIEIPGATQFIPQGVIPEISIPEFKLPVIDIPEFEIPDWGKLIPDFDDFIPNIPDEIKIDIDIPDLIPDITGSIDGLGFGEVVEAGKSLIQSTNVNLADYLTDYERGAEWFYEAIFQGGLFRPDAANSLNNLMWGIFGSDPQTWIPYPEGSPEAQAEQRAANILDEANITPDEFLEMSILDRETWFAEREQRQASEIPTSPVYISAPTSGAPGGLPQADDEPYVSEGDPQGLYTKAYVPSEKKYAAYYEDD